MLSCLFVFVVAFNTSFAFRGLRALIGSGARRGSRAGVEDVEVDLDSAAAMAVMASMQMPSVSEHGSGGMSDGCCLLCCNGVFCVLFFVLCIC